MTRDELIEMIRATDPVGAAASLSLDLDEPVTWTRNPRPGGLIDDGAIEGRVEDHRRAHESGLPSEATVLYGTAVPAEATADRLLELAELQAGSGKLRAVCPVPADGSPGSWGVQDLAVIAACRHALPGVVWVRPSWERLGASLCQVAVAFGANDWVLPEGDRTDPAHLAAAVGRRAVER